MNDKPILLKVKDWLELTMSATPWLNFCIGASVLILAVAKALHWLLPFWLP